MSRTTDSVIVVGAGPVGLLAALVLARQEVPVLVLEAEPGLTVDLRAGTYHPPSLEMMAPYGITDAMHRTGIRVPRWQIRDKQDGVIAEWDLSVLADVTSYPYRLHLEQHRLTPIIHAVLAECGTARIRFGHEVIEAGQDGQSAYVVARTARGTERLEAGWVVGADGGRSTVRKATGVDFEGFTWPDRFVVCSTTYDYEPHGYTYNAYIADPESWSALFKMPDDGPPGLWRIVFPVHPDESDETALSAARCQERMQGFLPQPQPYPLRYRSIYKVHQRVASDYRNGRLILAGDAAHLNNPLGAFGLNGGIHDAINLGEKLGRVCRGEAGPEVLDLYTRQRRTANIEQVQAVSIQNKQRLEARDSAVRRKNFDELRRTAADPQAAREFMLTNSMIHSVRRAAAVT